MWNGDFGLLILLNILSEIQIPISEFALALSKLNSDTYCKIDLGFFRSLTGILLRKEVIQPQVPLRLPCYDFIPVTSYTLGPYPLAVDTGTSGATGFHDVTGGVYKTRERIHGTVADVPLLAIPTSWRRVAASNPNWAQFYRFPPPRGLGSHCTGHCSTCAAQGVRAILT